MRKLSYLIILAGVLIMLYPKGSEWYNDRQQQKLLEEAEQAYSEIVPSATAPAGTDLSKPYAEVTQLLAEESAAEEPVPSATPDIEVGGKITAIIEIDKIDLKLPVLEGATKNNMKHAAAHMKETAPIGAVGNAAIAAHRSRTAGRLFNRLNEVGEGDTITIITSGHEYKYVVYGVSIVEPTDVSVLKGKDDDKILTLITCDPLVDPTHRLIIHAKLT
ncbi:class D sortase [Paenibacillus tritici]|uniref:Class D sortase n=1 Tax=Paenibacillus tritici TaxID=1873425 RepID=A0ABX2DVW9_9BACL|nr:class D sortase [Paenibacillus tritici]NQX48853.1 class D sortase [Paenibacillus tritici]QUL55598.1 class D sortase [Paenibacillus tritici]